MAEHTSPLAKVVGVAVAVYDGVTRDGAIGASFNQARDEIKEGLRALPDSIHVQPVSIAGYADTADQQPTITVHGPNQDQAAGKAAEIAPEQGNTAEVEHLLSPSEIVRGDTQAATVHGQVNDRTVSNTVGPSHELGNGAAEEHLPSPSEIARDDTPYVPEHDQGHELSHDLGRSR